MFIDFLSLGGLKSPFHCICRFIFISSKYATLLTMQQRSAKVELFCFLQKIFLFFRCFDALNLFFTLVLPPRSVGIPLYRLPLRAK